MAKQIEGVSERILSCARAEFLDKGYTDASLRVIAAAAETSTNSIYVRFKDKEGLFSAIVEPVLNEMIERFLKIQEAFHHMDGAAQRAHMAEYADGGTMELVRIEVEYTYKYMKAAGCPVQTEGALTERLLHIVTTSRFESIFEVIRHGMSREEAAEYIGLLSRYHRAGFASVFGVGA